MLKHKYQPFVLQNRQFVKQNKVIFYIEENNFPKLKTTTDTFIAFLDRKIYEKIVFFLFVLNNFHALVLCDNVKNFTFIILSIVKIYKTLFYSITVHFMPLLQNQCKYNQLMTEGSLTNFYVLLCQYVNVRIYFFISSSTDFEAIRFQILFK